MTRRKKDIEEEVEEVQEEELSEKEQKKLKLKTSAEKRKNIKKKDKVARWGGIILLGLVMFVGFLLWISGEIKQESSQQVAPINSIPSRSSSEIAPPSSPTNTIIVR